MSDLFGAMIVLYGPEVARAAGAPLARLSDRALQEIEAYADSSTAEHVVDVLSFVNAAECCGAVTGQLSPTLLARWTTPLVKTRRSLDEALAARAALAALAGGEATLALKLAGAKAPARFTPGETCDVDPRSLARYLAAAAGKEASAAVEPAFVAFVRGFPPEKAAGRLDWSDLFWAARVYYARFDQRSIAEVGAAVHALVKTFG
ncbi:MAG: hypothetical protein QM820_64835 [Minicystis sp.]